MTRETIDLTNGLVVASFRHALFVDGLFWLTCLAVVLLGIAVVAGRVDRFDGTSHGDEPRSRTYVRRSFGALWILDGVLQFQASMPLGLANNVVAPMTANTPSWLHSLMNRAVYFWNIHPLTLAVGVAWLQLGIGLMLLVTRGRLSRVVAGVSLAWAAVIWLIGNGAGGIFSRGASFLFGWPGASLFYVIAGAWLAVRDDTFRKWFSRDTLRLLSVLALVGAVLQSLPSGGFWRRGDANSLTAMTASMSSLSQPRPISWFVHLVGKTAASLGGGFNALVVTWLLLSAVGLWMAGERGWDWPSRVFAVGCVLFWFGAEDTAVFGGLGTDVNSLVPVALLALWASPCVQSLPPRPRRVGTDAAVGARAAVAAFALAMMVFAVVTLTGSVFAGAETTLFLARNGRPTATDAAAARFTLTDQFNRPYALGQHRGHVTLLTFLDPRCRADCPLLASQLARVRNELSANAPLDVVVVALDPSYETVSDLRHFIARRRLAHLTHFYVVTGTLGTMRVVWRDYGVSESLAPTSRQSLQSDVMFIVGRRRVLRWIIPDIPLATASGQASAVAELHSLLATVGVH